MNMRQDEYEKASADELWDYCMEEYRSANPLIKWLLNRFYGKITTIVDELSPDYRLLEIGCGAGESSRRIGQHLRGQYFEASEYDQRFVDKILESDFPYKITQESVYSLDRESNSFDGVFLLEVLEHLEDYELALKEIFRVTRKYAVISTPNEPLWSILNMVRGKYLKNLGNTPGHINRWSLSSLKTLLGKHGNIVQSYSPIPWNIVVVEKF